MPPADPAAHPPSCGDLVGVLAEPARRRVFAALVLGATSVREVADRADLTPTAAAALLQRLVDGRVAVADRNSGTFEVDGEAFRQAIRAEVRVSGPRGDGAGGYFRRGRLQAIPGDAAVRSRVLAVVAEVFRADEVYSEPQVNALCGEWFDDWATLRRALVDDGLLGRDAGSATYRRIHATRDGMPE